MFGILIGLGSAFLQSCSYLASGSYVREVGRPAYTLVPPSFLIMGLMALPFFPFVCPEQMPPLTALLPGMLQCILCCFLGNAGMFFLLKHVDSSRSSPLLALKVPLMALWFALILGETISSLQWVAIALVLFSAWLLGGAGRPISRKAWFWLLVACSGYIFSDLGIRETFNAVHPYFDPDDMLGRSLFSCIIIHVTGGIFGLLLMPFVGKWTRPMIARYAFPYAFFWFTGMIVLYLSFAVSGLVLGNIFQSTRGLISVVLGWFIARSGRTVLEEKVSSGLFLRRIFAALVIIAAMALYNL